jgi:hypothetical protein
VLYAERASEVFAMISMISMIRVIVGSGGCHR